MQIELLLVVIVKALAELAAMFLLGRGLLWLLAGGRRMDNVFYQVLAVVTDPLLDGYIPAITFALVAWVWLAIVFWALPEMCASGYDCSALLERKRGA